MLLDEPSHDINIGAKTDVFEIMNHYADEGLSLPEAIADRIIVLNSSRRLTWVTPQLKVFKKGLITLAEKKDNTKLMIMFFKGRTLIVLALLVVFSLATLNFLSTNTMLLLAKHVTFYGILAIGMTCVIITTAQLEAAFLIDQFQCKMEANMALQARNESK